MRLSALPGVQGLVWDHDGTLVDSLPVVVAATNAVLESRGLQARPAPLIVAGMVEPTAPRMGGLAGVSDPPVQADLAAAFYREAHRVGTRLARAYLGIDQVVEACASAGLQQAVLSNNQGRLVRQLMAHLHLDRRMRFLWGEEDVVAPKPDPRGMAAAAAALGVLPGACIAIGDGVGDVPAAHGAGMRIIGVTWGIHARSQMLGMGFDALVDSPRELASVLLG